jgi:hypothetical protein
LHEPRGAAQSGHRRIPHRSYRKEDAPWSLRGSQRTDHRVLAADDVLNAPRPPEIADYNLQAMVPHAQRSRVADQYRNLVLRFQRLIHHVTPGSPGSPKHRDPHNRL